MRVQCKTANMREIVKAEGGKKLQTASRRNRSGVNFVRSHPSFMSLPQLNFTLSAIEELEYKEPKVTVF
jgi:hypothetical protein